MGVQYNTSIVTSGLQIYVDAENNKSYPGTGTTWTDLSGNGYNATLTNTHITFQGDSLLYNGNSALQCYAPNSGFFATTVNNLQGYAGYAWTVDAWFKFPVSPTTTRTGNQCYSIGGIAGGIGGGETFNLFVGSGTDSTYGSYAPYYCTLGLNGSKTILSPSSVNTNTWNNVVVTFNGTSGVGYFNNTTITNLNVGTAAAQTGYYLGIGCNSVTGVGTFANANHIFEGSIGNFKIYNRALSSTEVSKNFNALRGRYGI